MTIWLNGQLVENGTIAAAGAGATLGWGVFTTVGIRDGAPIFLYRHFERLSRDAQLAEIPLSTPFEAVEKAVVELLHLHSIQDGLARLTLTRRGDGRWNTAEGADFLIMALETAPPAMLLRVQLSPYRTEAKRPLVGVKTTSYLPYLWAWRETKAQGFDEAILRDGRDFLSEGARSSLFWIKSGELYTPALETGCLRGLGRDLILEWVVANGFTVHEGHFKDLDVLGAEETYLVSAATGPRFISSWHDEDGGLLQQWDEAGEFGRGLKAWWDS